LKIETRFGPYIRPAAGGTFELCAPIVVDGKTTVLIYALDPLAVARLSEDLGRAVAAGLRTKVGRPTFPTSKTGRMFSGRSSRRKGQALETAEKSLVSREGIEPSTT
jgi:hypothetical protein